MPEVKKYHLIERLLEADKRFNKSPAVTGLSSLTFAGYINSTRTQMFTSHLKQFLNILYPQFPAIFTGAENTFGDNSTGYKKVKHDSRVVKKITKYEDIIDVPTSYYLFIYDEKKDKYDVIQRKEVENLIEDFAFKYDNDVIDSLEEGDLIHEDEVLYKSRSYDESMNYRYGTNATVIYVLDPWTSEDAAKISESFSKRMSSVKAKTHSISINLGEVGINLYGDDEEYKIIPDIGERCNGFLCGVRAVRKEQIYYDLSDENLCINRDGDRMYYGSGYGSIVSDIDIYCNNEELQDNDFNSQVLKYLNSQTKFYEEIIKTCKEIIKSGSKYTQEVDYLYKRAKEFLNPKKKWRNKNESCPANLEIAITCVRIEPLGIGGKFTGRMGNKSVVSKVVPDENMPFTDTGKIVDVELHLPAIPNRTTGFVPHELFETFVLNRTRERMATMTTLKEKENLLFEVMEDLNSSWKEKQWLIYKNLSKEEKEEYIKYCVEEHIHIQETPIWEDRYIFFRLYDVWKKYDWLKPYKMYIRKWGQTFETLTPMYVGEMYMIRLKQTSERGFSARNSGAINIKNMPERSYKNRNGTAFSSDSAIRLGESEFLTLNIGSLPEETMALHALYRTSIKGRKDISRAMFSDDPNSMIDDSYTSVAAQLFSVIFKSLGAEIVFEDEDEVVKPLDDIVTVERNYDGATYFLSDYEFYLLKKENEIKDKIQEEHPLIYSDDLDRLILEEMNKVNGIIGPRKDILE